MANKYLIRLTPPPRDEVVIELTEEQMIAMMGTHLKSCYDGWGDLGYESKRTADLTELENSVDDLDDIEIEIEIKAVKK